MRTRKHFVGLWLNDQEHRRLMKQCSVSGLTASGLLRQTILGIELRPRPPDTYAALLRELSAIGNNVNQIAHNTNASKSASQAEIDEAVKLVRQAWRLVKDTL